MSIEMEDLKLRGVIGLAQLPEGTKLIPCRWVFDRDRNKLREIL